MSSLSPLHVPLCLLVQGDASCCWAPRVTDSTLKAGSPSFSSSCSSSPESWSAAKFRTTLKSHGVATSYWVSPHKWLSLSPPLHFLSVKGLSVTHPRQSEGSLNYWTNGGVLINYLSTCHQTEQSCSVWLPLLLTLGVSTTWTSVCMGPRTGQGRPGHTHTHTHTHTDVL